MYITNFNQKESPRGHYFVLYHQSALSESVNVYNILFAMVTQASPAALVPWVPLSTRRPECPARVRRDPSPWSRQ